MQKELIYLADLTHTGQIVASNVSPLGIGLIASYLLKSHAHQVDIELFKYPEDFSRALATKIPRLVGFANYSWNLDLAYRYATRIKEVSPDTVVVFGGPNYGLTLEEIEDFWKRFPLIDFYVVKEGEVAFENLYRLLAQNKFSVAQIKAAAVPPANCHYISSGELKMGEILPRLTNLSVIGSPYLNGLMDKFFDGVLIPMIHTTRGCPFTCTFCSEGSKYYGAVAQRVELEEELTYIAERKGTVQDLVITDANFGMYDEDRAKAETIKRVKEKYNWPQHIIVSTGKNKKEKIIEVAGILKGSMSIAASLQSTDQAVLKNINRSNISIDALTAVVKQSEQVDATTYTEIILGLPGDSIATHTRSLRDVTTAGLGVVRMYQLILLPQTELNTPDTRRKYQIETKFRINPRSFGKYSILGHEIVSIEHEEILVSSLSLSFTDYLHCRELDLTVEMLHNSGMFLELAGLCSHLGYSWFDLLLRFFNNRRQHGESLALFYDNFSKDSQVGLWNSRQELERHVRHHIEEYIANTDGTNEMAKSKAIAFFQHLRPLHDALYSEMRALCTEKGEVGTELLAYLDEAKDFSIRRKENFVNFTQRSSGVYHYDFFVLEKLGFKVDPCEFHHEEGVEYFFYHNQSQIDMINSYVGQYGGRTIDGLGRILMRAPAKRMFRGFSSNQQHLVNTNNKFSSLNVYGGFSV